MTVSAGYDHLLGTQFFSKESLGETIPFLFTTNSGTHAGIIPRMSLSPGILSMLCASLMIMFASLDYVLRCTDALRQPAVLEAAACRTEMAEASADDPS